MLEDTPEQTTFCNVCAHEWGGPDRSGEDARPDAGAAPAHVRYQSLETFIAATGIRRDELATLADCFVLDVHLPGISGTELRGKLLASGVSTPIRRTAWRH